MSENISFSNVVNKQEFVGNANQSVTGDIHKSHNHHQLFPNQTTQLPISMAALPCSFPLTPAFDYTSLAVAVSIIFLNGFALTLFCTKKKLRKLAGNYILASLSFNDLLNGVYILFKLFPHLYLYNNDCSKNQRTFFEIEMPTISRTIYRALMLSSVLHLVLLSTDRLIYVVYALSYNSLVGKKKIIKLICISWIACIVASAIQLIWSLIDGPLNEYRKVLRFYHTLVLAVLFIVFPSVILFSQSITMVIIVRKLGISQNSQCSSGRKAFVLYVCMYMKFVLFSYPYFVISLLLEMNQGHIFVNGKIPIIMIRVFLITRFLPCLINPCLYTLQNKDYRSVIKSTIQKFRNENKSRLDRYASSYRSHSRYSPAVTNHTTAEILQML